MRVFRLFVRLGWPVGLVLVAMVAAARAEPARQHAIYLPLVTRPQATVADCNVPGSSFARLSVQGRPLSVDVEKDPDVNLGVRGYAPVDAPLQLVSYDGAQDPAAPQFPTFFADRRVPAFSSTHQRYRWDYDCGCPTDTSSPWPTTVLGMRTAVGEIIHAPDSGYDIGGGYEYLVMYASEQRVTLHIGRDDGFQGYVIHVEGVCPDPDLVALYRQLNAAGRAELPALRGREPFGRAITDEIRVAVRDVGHFLDPRSRHNWWRGR